MPGKIKDGGAGPYTFRVDHQDPADATGLKPTVHRVDFKGRNLVPHNARALAAQLSRKFDAAYVIAIDARGRDVGQVCYYDGRVGGREGDTGGA